MIRSCGIDVYKRQAAGQAHRHQVGRDLLKRSGVVGALPVADRQLLAAAHAQ